VRNDLQRNETLQPSLPEKTRARYEQLAGLLLLGGSLAEVCRYGGISRTSLYRLMRRDDFKAVLSELRGHALAAVRANLAAAASDAVDLLSATVRDTAAPLALRLRAAALVIQATVTDETNTRPPVDHRHLHAHFNHKENDHVQH